MEKTNSAEKKPNELVKIPVKWLVAVIIIIVVLALVFILLNSGIILKRTNAELSEKEATTNLLNFFATQVPESNVTFISASRQGSLYEITVNIDGQEVPIFVTVDGKYLIVNPIPLT